MFGLMLWALLGGLSHTFFDLFNSYGAKFFWPIINKKYSIDLMNPVDPIFTLSLAGCVFTSGDIRKVCMYLFILYPVTRFILRFAASKQIRKVFGQTSKKISLLPSMTGLFRWHFVLEKDNCNIVGEKTMFRRNIRIIQKLNKIQDEILEKVHITYVGRVFMEITPIYHVISEKIGSITRYVLIDMRYYTGNDFLHHAVLEVDENDYIVFSSFNAYSIKRVSNIPAPSEKTGTVFSRFVGF
ncbi:MAG: metal-dependent hydrolase, partial [Clostridiaceae bacterium]|nr:metal-dependent hydrolase [Clostridiaceae bacterium]